MCVPLNAHKNDIIIIITRIVIIINVSENNLRISPQESSYIFSTVQQSLHGILSMMCAGFLDGKVRL